MNSITAYMHPSQIEQTFALVYQIGRMSVLAYRVAGMQHTHHQQIADSPTLLLEHIQLFAISMQYDKLYIQLFQMMV